MKPRLIRTSRGLAVILALFACGGGAGPPDQDDDTLHPPPDGTDQFTVVPVDLSRIPIITPLGSLGPPGHVLPTDHVYFYQTDFDHFPPVQGTELLPVLAPAAGTLSFILEQYGGDYKIQFIATEDFGWYLDHILPRASLHLGSVVHAGDTLGTTIPGGTLDLGAWDTRVNNAGFLNPARYGTMSLHAVSPWKYFAEPLRTMLRGRMRRHPDIADKDGKIDFDVSGKLIGNWYEASAPADGEAQGPLGWPKTVAFVYDYYDPRLVRISIGGTIAPPGVWTLPLGTPIPAVVSVASGKVAYRLMYTGSTEVQYGLMLVQLLTDSSVKLEVLVGSQAGDAEFTANARLYYR